MYQANLRQGSHQTKSRGMVAGSTKKMYRQKGTGNARAGSKRSGIRRGGGHIHRIHNRDYSYRLPRKALQLATRMALAAKVRDDELVVIDDLAFAEPRDQGHGRDPQAPGLRQGQSLLVATAKHDANVYRSARNIAGVSVSPAGDLNALTRAVVAASAGDQGGARRAGGVGQGARQSGRSQPAAKREAS